MPNNRHQPMITCKESDMSWPRQVEHHEPASKIEHGVIHVRMPRVPSKLFEIAEVPVRVVLDSVFHPNVEISISLTIILLRRRQRAIEDFSHVVISTIAQAVSIVGGATIRDSLGRTGIVVAESVRDVSQCFRHVISVGRSISKFRNLVVENNVVSGSGSALYGRVRLEIEVGILGAGDYGIDE